MTRTTELDSLQDFITRVSLFPTVTDVKVKLEADRIRLTAYDRQNGFLIAFEEDTNDAKTKEIKNTLENNKVNFSDGEWSEENIK